MEIELTSIELHEAEHKDMSKSDSFVTLIAEETVETSRGVMKVTIQGKQGKPAVFTYHDIGQNHISAFQGFFNFHEIQPLLENFCIYHLDAPGQEENAPSFLPEYEFPSMDELADLVGEVLQHFKLKRFIGFGVGAGANILCRYALKEPNKVDALILVNCYSTSAGWVEWGYQKMSSWYLKGNKMTKFSEDYLMWHHFGYKTMETHHDLARAFKESIETLLNPYNLSLFIDKYITRPPLKIARPIGIPPVGETIKCPVLLLTGIDSPHEGEVVETYAKLDPHNSNYIKLSDCGAMVLEEQPSAVTTAFKYFLQGLGYIPSMKVSVPHPPPQHVPEDQLC